MRICFFGLGSIGTKHLLLLNKYYKFDIWSYESIENRKYDIAFITNVTSSHIDTAIKCIKAGAKYLFIEKPLDCTTDNLDVLLKLVDKNKITAYVAYPFRHHPTIAKLKRPYYKKWSYFYCQTDFRLWRKYKTYSHTIEQGGALLELSHEIDTARYLFGKIKRIEGNIDYSEEYGFDRQAWLRIEHCNQNVSFHLLNIMAPEENRFMKFRRGKRIYYKATDEMYANQLHYFFSNLDNPNLDNNIFDAAETFRKIIKFRCEN